MCEVSAQNVETSPRISKNVIFTVRPITKANSFPGLSESERKEGKTWLT
jgi:hypothetical protein